ncbi:MAG: IS4 family transposase [Proteobacteria bacterium]|nr:IS4 family transposase [Pseudomonadota bacterium]
MTGTNVHAILVKEQTPPAGEDAIEWILLTNLPIDSPEEIETIIQWYVCRWEIEIYFRVLKNGCQVQKLQLETQARFEACLGIYMIVAWRLLCMTMRARQCPKLPYDVIFDEDEGQSLYITVKQAPPPQSPPTLNVAIDMIATLGDYLGRKNDGPPGTKTVWIGIQRMRDFTLAISGYKKVSLGDETYV